MSRLSSLQATMPSVLDRLIDPSSEGTSWRPGFSLEQLVNAVRRDLEDLLNSHPPYYLLPEEWAELNNSLLTFGLPDFSLVNSLTDFDRQQIASVIEEIIGRFEPRLRNIKASCVATGSSLERNVRFHIEAQLNMDPAPAVSFDTIIELTTGHTTVNPSETNA